LAYGILVHLVLEDFSQRKCLIHNEINSARHENPGAYVRAPGAPPLHCLA